jgi:hypothetical protein
VAVVHTGVSSEADGSGFASAHRRTVATR